MILTVTPNPCVDKTVFIDELKVGTFMRSQRYTCVPGGKGTNVSRAVKTLGRATRALVVVGGHPGRHVVDMIREQDGVEPIPVWVASQTRTITTVLEEPIHRQTAFFEPGSRVTEAEAASFVETFAEAVVGVEIVTFQRHRSGSKHSMAVQGTGGDRQTRWRNHDTGCPRTGVRTGPRSTTLYGQTQRRRSRRTVGAKPRHGRSQVGRRGYLPRAWARPWSCYRLARRERWSRAGDERFHVIPPSIKEVNPVGSGDALVAGFAVGLLEKMSLRDTTSLAVAAGAANAMSWDIGHFSAAEVDTLRSQVTFA